MSSVSPSSPSANLSSLHNNFFPTFVDPRSPRNLTNLESNSNSKEKEIVITNLDMEEEIETNAPPRFSLFVTAPGQDKGQMIGIDNSMEIQSSHVQTAANMNFRYSMVKIPEKNSISSTKKNLSSPSKNPLASSTVSPTSNSNTLSSGTFFNSPTNAGKNSGNDAEKTFIEEWKQKPVKKEKSCFPFCCCFRPNSVADGVDKITRKSSSLITVAEKVTKYSPNLKGNEGMNIDEEQITDF